MGDAKDLNIEAYRIMVEILVTLRRIIQRGLEKASGTTWYLDGCPPGLYERLVARKENEVAIDRFDRDYQELLSFASLDDLADIIEFNQDLERLLTNIAPEKATMVERCRQIETLRLKLDASVPYDETDFETLVAYHQDFQNSLSKPKKSVKPAKAPAPEPAPEPAEEKPPPAVEPVKPPPVEPVKPPPVEPVKPPPVKPVTPPAVEPISPPAAELPSRPVAEPASEPLVEPVPAPTGEPSPSDAGVGESAGEPGTTEAEVDELGAEDLVPDEAEEGAAETGPEEVTAADEGAEEPDDRAVDSGVIEAAEVAAAEDDLALEAVQAMADDDDPELLRVLHREIMSIAEHVLKGDVDQEFPVWQTLTVSGWYDIKKATLALTPIELFFSVAEEIRTKHRAGASEEEITAFIDESEVTKLLLTLGDTFKRQNL